MLMPACGRIPPYRFRKIKHRGKIAVISYEGGQFSLFFVEDFTDRKGLMRCKCAVPHFSQETADAGGITEHAADVAEAVRTVRCVVAEGQDFFDIDATIVCERDSHKGIIIGKGGAMLKKIGSTARYEIEQMLDMKVNLKLWVKVKKDWRDSDFLIKNFGYDKKLDEL